MVFSLKKYSSSSGELRRYIAGAWWVNGKCMAGVWWVNGKCMAGAWWVHGKCMVGLW